MQPFVIQIRLKKSLVSTMHRVGSDIESSLKEIIGSKNYLSLNFCETMIYDDKVFPEHLFAVH